MSATWVKRIAAVVMIGVLLVPASMLALAAEDQADSAWTELGPGTRDHRRRH